jgi:hypothetical protein
MAHHQAQQKMHQAPAQHQMQQQGGMVDSIHLLLHQLDSPAKLLYGFILILLIVYSPVISTDYRIFTDSFLGRVFGIAIVYGVTESLGWAYGLLTAMAFLLILNGAPRLPMFMEGFEGGGSISEKTAITHGKRWFVEQVLGECPSKIDTDRVSTQAVQD